MKLVKNLYYILSHCFLLLVPFLLLIRLYKNKEILTRVKERFGIATQKPMNNSQVIVIHAASVGELLSLSNFIKELANKFESEKINKTIVITTITVSSYNSFRDKISNLFGKFKHIKIIHQFFPYDIPFACNKFLSYWKPEKLFFVESEIWPNFVYIAYNKSIPLYLLNARISDRSFKKWSKIPSFFEDVINKYNFIFPQSDSDMEKIRNFYKNKENCLYLGNLKFDSVKPNCNEEIDKKLQYIYKNKKVIIFASNHVVEEEIILKMLNNILKENLNHNIAVIIAPRHPDKAIKLAEKMRENYNIILDSEIMNLNKTHDNEILIVDSLGKIGNYYNISDIAIICGSFVDGIGGHNPIEPAYFHNFIITGPYYANAIGIYNEFSKAKAAKILSNNNEINKVIIDYLNSIEYAEYAENAYKLVSQYEKISTKFINKIF